MSYGKLCGAKIKIATSINVENDIEVSCDLYEGHEGPHSKMFYHTVPIPKAKWSWERHNHRLGRITWKNEM